MVPVAVTEVASEPIAGCCVSSIITFSSFLDRQYHIPAATAVMMINQMSHLNFFIYQYLNIFKSLQVFLHKNYISYHRALRCTLPAGMIAMIANTMFFLAAVARG